MNPVYLAGTCDTKQAELDFVRARITQLGVPVVLVDLSTQQPHTGQADVSARSVAACHPQGEQAVFTGDRGSSGTAMALAFAAYITQQGDVGGLLGLGGSGGTALITPAMRALPIGVPKLMVSTMASGNVAPYVGGTDIAMMYSVTDVAGLNRVSRQILGNAASAVAGMVRDHLAPSSDDRPALGLTMFGVTTPCVQGLRHALQEKYDCLVFHATGTGGMSMEKLIDSGMIIAALDITTTEIADLLFGGVLACPPDRLDSVIRTQVPYLGSVGALDMVNFASRDTVPSHLSERNFYIHNDNVTLMRTTPDENVRMGRWLAARLNRMNGPVRFLLPEGGVSILDAPDMPFHDPEVDCALFDMLEREVQQTEQRRLIRVPGNINSPEFGVAALAHFRELLP